MNNSYLFTSESVTEGHPDKMADQIADSILDYLLKEDKHSKVACEVLLTTGMCLIAGEINTKVYAPITDIVREVIREIGYTNAEFGFDYRTAGILNTIGEQSLDIKHAISKNADTLGAGDQGMMFGYACNETKEFMPLAISLANKLCFNLARVRKNGTIPYLRPDGKAQVTIEYENNKPKRVHTIVLCAQHKESIPQNILKDDLIEEVIKDTIPKELLDEETIYHINPTGRFVIGGPTADTGLTGRKIIVDSYGGSCSHGGGSFSGKDPSKVDRSAAYMARYVAKNLVAAGICEKISIQVSYAISLSNPISLMVDTFKTSKYTNEQILENINKIFDFSVASIIESLNLYTPLYKKSSVYGHFGREDQGFKWEETDKIEEIKKLFSEI